MGTQKFASFLFLKVFILSTLLQCILLVLSNGYLSPGPYPYVGAMLYLYTSFTPRLYPNFVRFLGWEFSEKAITYFFTLQLIIHDGWSSIVPAICGYLSGTVATSPSTPFGNYDPRFPQFIYRISDKIGQMIGLSELLAPPPTIVRGMRGRQVRGRGYMGGSRTSQRLVPGAALGTPRPSAHLPPQYEQLPQAPPPSEEAINQLTMMGFEREAVIRALNATDNNLEAAANRLLSS